MVYLEWRGCAHVNGARKMGANTTRLITLAFELFDRIAHQQAKDIERIAFESFNRSLNPLGHNCQARLHEDTLPVFFERIDYFNGFRDLEIAEIGIGSFVVDSKVPAFGASLNTKNAEAFAGTVIQPCLHDCHDSPRFS